MSEKKLRYLRNKSSNGSLLAEIVVGDLDGPMLDFVTPNVTPARFVLLAALLHY
jgi:hypothetical protein